MSNTNVVITTNYRTITHILQSLHSGLIGQNADVSPATLKGRTTKYQRVPLGAFVLLRCSEPGRQGLYGIGQVVGKDPQIHQDTVTWPGFTSTHRMRVHWLVAGVGADSYIPHEEVESVISHRALNIQPTQVFVPVRISAEQILQLMQMLQDRNIQAESLRNSWFNRAAV